MISLKNVSFSYDGKENNGLHNVSLEIPKGQCVLPVSYTHLDVYKRQGERRGF